MDFLDRFNDAFYRNVLPFSCGFFVGFLLFSCGFFVGFSACFFRFIW